MLAAEEDDAELPQLWGMASPETTHETLMVEENDDWESGDEASDILTPNECIEQWTEGPWKQTRCSTRST